MLSSSGKRSVKAPLSLKTFKVSLFCLLAEGSIRSIMVRFSLISSLLNLAVFSSTDVLPPLAISNTRL
ncbi:hypothetical protein MBAV_005140 [Candidatus Magnetobacterium bavaricum]|uniref:Uncharacterized protein n=1 Tax=Candidatus Magnetobacterium bavaricum TaxID=29290 RepID=A0A0F3GLE9_9BACT|nr:hypothetical protein MBAV_005140 [Candidatus Magnetobacterium bavaricum]